MKSERILIHHGVWPPASKNDLELLLLCTVKTNPIITIRMAKTLITPKSSFVIIHLITSYLKNSCWYIDSRMFAFYHYGISNQWFFERNNVSCLMIIFYTFYKPAGAIMNGIIPDAERHYIFRVVHQYRFHRVVHVCIKD